MIRLINCENSAAYPSLVRAMHADRKRVFVDMLGWGLNHDSDLEQDRFDNADAEYLVLTDRISGDHLASMRLLHTDRPHLMTEVFPHLCEGGVLSGPEIREITRFCVAPRGRAADRRLARNMLVRSMVEYALLTGIRTFTAACNMGFLSEVLSAGWRCRPLGLPEMFDGALVGALRIDIDGDTLRSLVGSWSCAPVELRLADALPTKAAA